MSQDTSVRINELSQSREEGIWVWAAAVFFLLQNTFHHSSPRPVVLKVWCLNQKHQHYLETSSWCTSPQTSWIRSSSGVAWQTAASGRPPTNSSEHRLALHSSLCGNPRWHNLTSPDKFLNFSLKVPLQLRVLIEHISTCLLWVEHYLMTLVIP